MPEVSDFEVRRIAEQIVCYLRDHPHAADTIEGVSEWWLRNEGIEASTVKIQQALDYLCSKSVVTCHVHPSGNNIYSSKQAKDE